MRDRRSSRRWATAMVRPIRAAHVASMMALAVVPAVSRADDTTANKTPRDKEACIAAAEQGQSQRDDGKYRAARAAFVRCSADSCPRVIVESCTKWLHEIDENAPTIVLGAKDEQGTDLTDVAVTFDGAPFATLLDGKPVEVDTGEHVLHFERRGSMPVDQRIVLRAGEKARGVSVTLKVANATEPSTSTSAAPSGAEPVEATHERALSARHVVAGSLALGALAAVATGIFFSLAAHQNQTDAAAIRTTLGPIDACTVATSDTTIAMCASLGNKVDTQHADLNASTALFAAGGALVAGAVVTWLVWPSGRSTAPSTTTGAAVVPLPGGAALDLSVGF